MDFVRLDSEPDTFVLHNEFIEDKPNSGHIQYEKNIMFGSDISEFQEIELNPKAEEVQGTNKSGI